MSKDFIVVLFINAHKPYFNGQPYRSDRFKLSINLRCPLMWFNYIRGITYEYQL